jgi:hypothetical protein
MTTLCYLRLLWSLNLLIEDMKMSRNLRDLTKLYKLLLFQALDDDAEAPNNEVQYEIVSGNRNEMFHINIRTGMYITETWTDFVTAI